MEDKKAIFLKAYEEHSDAIFRYCLFKISDREIALDIMQDTFTKTWEYMMKKDQGKQNEEIQNIKAFLYRVAGNLVIDQYRKKTTDSLEVLQEDGFDPSFDDTEILIDRLDGIKAIELLSKLPKDYKEALFLKYVQGLSISEISEVTGDEKNTVTVRLHRGMEKLKALFDNKLNEQAR